jgi:hypothetical protein
MLGPATAGALVVGAAVGVAAGLVALAEALEAVGLALSELPDDPEPEQAVAVTANTEQTAMPMKRRLTRMWSPLFDFKVVLGTKNRAERDSSNTIT